MFDQSFGPCDHGRLLLPEVFKKESLIPALAKEEAYLGALEDMMLQPGSEMAESGLHGVGVLPVGTDRSNEQLEGLVAVLSCQTVDQFTLRVYQGRSL